MRILLWHIHGSWTTSFVHGRHEYVVPVTPDRGPDGLGRAGTYRWPDTVVEVPATELAGIDVDVVLLQRSHEAALGEQLLHRRPGRDVPAVYVEHNTPPTPFSSRHPMADQTDITIVHVTHFNRLMWDAGRAPTAVIEHGIVDPGYAYTGELPRAAVVVNEPIRRGRAVGADLWPALTDAAPVDVFGMRVSGLAEHLGARADRLCAYEDPGQAEMHRQLARRRVYVHTSRWTSLGLSLLEAMHLGMPVVVLACTEAAVAVPRAAGLLTMRPDEMAAAITRFVHEPAAARAAGAAARAHALEHYGLDRFLADWDAVLAEVAV
ncbi:MAG: glycosyltransferase [Jiangellaceae bacterium]|nr:glycosyltransferase [Jiangellaceae bacterium]